MSLYFLGPLYFLYSLGNLSPDPSRLAEDDLGDNNHVAIDLAADSPKDSEANYFLADSVSLLKTEPTWDSL